MDSSTLTKVDHEEVHQREVRALVQARLQDMRTYDRKMDEILEIISDLVRVQSEVHDLVKEDVYECEQLIAYGGGKPSRESAIIQD